MRAALRFFSRRRIDVQYQAEAAECGLACIAMILSYHGQSCSVSSLRQRWPLTRKGLTLEQLTELAHKTHLSARPLRLEVDELSGLMLPAILHWRLNHFVVLERISRGRAVIVDPAIGRRCIASKALSESFSGVALELTVRSSFRPAQPKPGLQLRQFFVNTPGLTMSMLQLFVLSLALQIFVLLMPFYSQLVIDEIVVSRDTDLLRLAGCSFAGLAVFIATTSAFRSWVVVYTGSILSLNWSAALFMHLVRLPYEYFEKRHLGDIQSRFTSLGAIRRLITTQGVEGLIDGLMAITTFAVMVTYNANLAAITLTFLSAYVLVRFITYGKQRGASYEALIRNASADSFFLETLRAIVAIRNFGHELGRQQGFGKRMAESIAAGAQVARVDIWQQTARRLLLGVQNIVVVWTAAHLIIRHQFTAGMMVAFLAYNAHFAGSSIALVDRVFQFRLIRVHLDRLQDIVATEPEEPDHCPGRTHANAIGRKPTLAICNISFRYGENEPWVLQNLSFHALAGEQLAVSGPSGVGKSTLFKLMIGLLAPSRGRLDVGGAPLGQIGIANYRRQIGVVMQNDQLLSGTILSNVCFFAVKPDLQRVANACRTAGILDDVLSMPMQFQTLVGDMGQSLSGGQVQRLLLARALYRQPAILFLDEATSHLDADRESLLVQSISKLEMTRIIVAHRAETLQHADRVIELT